MKTEKQLYEVEFVSCPSHDTRDSASQGQGGRWLVCSLRPPPITARG